MGQQHHSDVDGEPPVELTMLRWAQQASMVRFQSEPGHGHAQASLAASQQPLQALVQVWKLVRALVRAQEQVQPLVVLPLASSHHLPWVVQQQRA